mmetsp:Transcript_47245/g.109308  ORF Transcript_47245/g.109308 Transcript_47245/m.109308 type:complete len:139 (+) Transcript_47245:88-504(+)
MGSFCEVLRHCAPARLDESLLDSAASHPQHDSAGVALPKLGSPSAARGSDRLLEMRRNADIRMAEMEATFDNGVFGTTSTASHVWTSSISEQHGPCLKAGSFTVSRAGADEGGVREDHRWSTHFWDTDETVPGACTPN